MADSKTKYSEVSKEYVEKDSKEKELDKERAKRSLDREREHGANWDKQKVNINEVVENFCPDAIGKTVSGVKFSYENDNYKIICDKVSGYLRIYDRNSKLFVKLDGKPGTKEETHFRIKKRGEM